MRLQRFIHNAIRHAQGVPVKEEEGPVDRYLIKEWYEAANDEVVFLAREFSRSDCKFELFEQGNHYANVALKIEANGLSITCRTAQGGFWVAVGTSSFPATTFLEIVNVVNAQIQERWKFLEDYREKQRKAIEEMDSILRKQVSSWKLLGKDVKPP